MTRCIFTATTSPSSNNPASTSLRRTSSPISTIPPVATSSYYLLTALSLSHSKQIIQAHGLSTATLHGTLPAAWPSRYWRGQVMLSPYWMADPMKRRKFTELAKPGINGIPIRKIFGMRSMARLAFRMIRGYNKKKGYTTGPPPSTTLPREL